MSFAYDQIVQSRPHPEPLAPEPTPAEMFAPDLEGMPYLVALEHLHHHYAPKTYLEIGTLFGDTLRLAKCAAIAVDPQFQLNQDVLGGKSSCAFYQSGSDQFFAEHDPRQLFGRSIDLAFLDGMHWFEFLLRDFVNTEKSCARNSVIVLHDCIPVDVYMARRDHGDSVAQAKSRHPHSWAGDVWKVVAILQKYRPDLQMHAFDAPPTGLVMLTGLDPDSRLLDDNYFSIVAEFAPLRLEEVGVQSFIDSLRLQPAALLSQQVEVSRMFWR